MEQQFEHLSDAQIENYGDRTGAGPNQPGDHGQAIETHLAACAGCRTRLLHFHRARFGIMNDQVPQQTQGSANSANEAGSPARDSAPDPAPENPAHKNPAPGAARFPGSSNLEHGISAAASRAPSASSRRSPDCPTEDALRDLAAGLSSPDAATRLTQHAAQCDHCGPILRAYTEDFSYDLSPEDETLLSQLNSASPSWQKKMAARMAEAFTDDPSSPSVSPVLERSARRVDGVAQPGSPSSPILAGRGGEPPSAVQSRTPQASRFRVPSFKWLLVPTTAIACALIAFFIWNAQRETPQKVEKLLARAYTEQRTMEMRIPYAAHADFKQTRGDTASLLSSPEALRKATEIIAANLKKNPDDPQWLLLSARLNLLDWHYKAALASLDKVADSQVNDSPEFLLTRSLAFYEQSEVSKESQGYFLAVDLLGRALQKAPDDPILFFNQAVACEKIHSYECAISDWDRVLAIEKDPNWTTEARKHLDQIKEKKNSAQ